MATHSSILAWRIPWTEEPGGLLTMGSQRVGHDCGDEHKRAHVSTMPAPCACSVSPLLSVWLLFLDGPKACVQRSASSFIWASEGKSEVQGRGFCFHKAEALTFPESIPLAWQMAY